MGGERLGQQPKDCFNPSRRIFKSRRPLHKAPSRQNRQDCYICFPRQVVVCPLELASAWDRLHFGTIRKLVCRLRKSFQWT